MIKLSFSRRRSRYRFGRRERATSRTTWRLRKTKFLVSRRPAIRRSDTVPSKKNFYQNTQKHVGSLETAASSVQMTKDRREFIEPHIAFLHSAYSMLLVDRSVSANSVSLSHHHRRLTSYNAIFLHSIQIFYFCLYFFFFCFAYFRFSVWQTHNPSSLPVLKGKTPFQFLQIFR